MYEWRYQDRGGCCNCCGCLTLALVLVVGLALLGAIVGVR
jgi:hypothetical protein